MHSSPVNKSLPLQDECCGEGRLLLGMANAEEARVGETIPSGPQALGSRHSNLGAEA